MGKCLEILSRFFLLTFVVNSSLIIAFAQPPTQEWVARYSGTSTNGANGLSIKQDSLGYIYVLTGLETDSTSGDYGLLKYTPSGNLLWSSVYRSPGDVGDNPAAFVVSPQGDVYITGNSSFNFTIHITTVKFNTSGILQWAKIYNGGGNNDEAFDIKFDKLNNIIIAGFSEQNALTIKYNNNGDTLWVKKFTGIASSTSIEKLCLDDSDNIYNAGAVSNPLDFLIIKYNTNGDIKWFTRFNSGTGDYSYDLAVDSFRNVYVVGTSAVPFSGPNNVLLKSNNNGIIQWAKTYRGLNGQNGQCGHPRGIVIDITNNFVYYSTFCLSGSGYALSTLKYNTQGDSIWVVTYTGFVNGIPAEPPAAIKKDKNNNIYVAARGIYQTTGDDYLIIKYSATGVQQWVAIYSGLMQNSDDFPSDIYIDTSLNVYVTGASTNNLNNGYDATTIKYNQIVGITNNHNEIPEDWKLYQNFPNPFNSNTIINYQIPFYSNVSLILYDILGRKIDELVNKNQNPGFYSIRFSSEKISSGIYFYKLKSDEVTIDTKKFILIK